MRILHICQRDDPDTGGSLRVAEALVQQQRLAGLDVWLLFLYGPPASIAAKYAPRIHCLGLESSREAMKGIVRLCGAVRKIKPDIIHSHDGIMWPRFAFPVFKTPVVMHSHLPVDLDTTAKGKVGWLLIKKTTNYLIGISLHTIETWVRAGYPPHKIHYVPNGVDFERFEAVGKEAKAALRRELGLPAEKHILLWVGRLHRSMKGSDRVERISGLLPDGMVFVVVGNGPEYEGMAARCRGLVDAGRMAMVGSTFEPERYYKAADAFLFTSYYEPFGLVILEAVSCGLPVVAFPVLKGGGAIELLKEFKATMLDDADDDASIMSTLEALSTRPATPYADMEGIRNRYGWRPVAKKVYDVYRLALNKTW